jgi:hypothetical protein
MGAGRWFILHMRWPVRTHHPELLQSVCYPFIFQSDLHKYGSYVFGFYKIR